MSDDKKPADILSELANVPFPNAAYLDAMKRVIGVQRQMLDGFQSNLDRWFERRREGAEAAMTMLNELNSSADAEKRADAWQRWASGAMARIMEDVQTQYDLMSKITSQLAETGEVMTPPAEGPQPERGKSPTRPPASRSARTTGRPPRTK